MRVLNSQEVLAVTGATLSHGSKAICKPSLPKLDLLSCFGGLIAKIKACKAVKPTKPTCTPTTPTTPQEPEVPEIG